MGWASSEARETGSKIRLRRGLETYAKFGQCFSTTTLIALYSQGAAEGRTLPSVLAVRLSRRYT